MALRRTFLVGATGRLGQALQRRLSGDALSGLARRAPNHPQAWQGFWQAPRRDVAALAAGLAQADAVIDLCGFDALDAEALLQAQRRSGRPAPPLVACSSVAERPLSHWTAPEDAAAPLADDAYGRDKRSYSQRLLDHWPGPCLVLLLPNLIETAPLDPRLQAWWRQAQASGVAALPGDGTQRPALLTHPLAAELIAALLARPTPPRGRLALAVPQPPSVLALSRALFAALQPPPRLQPGAERGLFSAGDEALDLTRQGQLLPAFPWPDLLTLMGELGQRLAAAPPG